MSEITTLTPKAVGKARQRPAPKTSVTEFVVKEELPDGTVLWVHPTEAVEIIMNAGTIPTPENLRMLAAHGIVPALPTLEDVREREDDSRAQYPQPDDEPDSALSRVITRLKTSAGDARVEVKVYKVGADSKEAYCATYPIEDYDEHGEELIRSHFGAGKYRVRVYGPSFEQSGNYGKFVRLTNELVEIVAGNAPVKLGGTETAFGNPAVEMLQRQLTALTEKLAQPQANQMDQLVQMVTLMKSLGLMGGGNKSQSLADSIREMRELQKFMKDAAPEKEGEGDDTLMGTLKPMLPGLLSAIQNRTQPQPQEIPVLQTPAFLGAPQQPEGENVNFVQEVLLNGMVAGYIAAAERNDPVEKYAEEVADKMPDEMIEMLETSFWFEALCETVPKHAAKLQVHRAWFTQMRDRVIALLNEPGDEEGGENETPEPTPTPVVTPKVAKPRAVK